MTNVIINRGSHWFEFKYAQVYVGDAFEQAPVTYEMIVPDDKGTVVYNVGKRLLLIHPRTILHK